MPKHRENKNKKMKINFIKNFQQFDKISNSLYLSAKIDRKTFNKLLQIILDQQSIFIINVLLKELLKMTNNKEIKNIEYVNTVISLMLKNIQELNIQIQKDAIQYARNELNQIEKLFKEDL